VASSLIRTMGLSDLVKPTIKEYIDFAVQLGIDGDKLASIALSVKRNRQSSALFDIQGFARGLETAFLHMREIHLRGEPPHAFDVSIH
jgi:predicted O-linked N-acetylglucosamine transferase (SPINDLY family)